MLPAEQAYRRANRLAPRNTELLRQLGNALKDLGKADEAEAAYREALALAPGDAALAYSLGALFFAEWRQAPARQALSRALALHPHHAPTLHLLGWLSKDAEQTDMALAAFRRFLLINPEDPLGWRALTVLHREEGRFDAAMHAIRRALALAPSDPKSLYELANLSVDHGQRRDADRAFRRGANLLPTFADLKARWSLTRFADNDMAGGLDLCFDALALPAEFRRTAASAFGGATTSRQRTAPRRDCSVTVATSLMPKRLPDQQAAVSSWLALGFDVVSVNAPEEIARLAPDFPNVRFEVAHRTAEALCGRPLIPLDEMLRVLREDAAPFCAIVNSDIVFPRSLATGHALAILAQRRVVFGNRRNVRSLEDGEGRLYKGGYDYFLFDRELLDLFSGTELVIGAPWWDYWIPLAAAMTGIPALCPTDLPALHRIHDVGYSRQLYLHFGRSLISAVAKVAGQFPPSSPVASMIAQGFTALDRARQAAAWDLTHESASVLGCFAVHAILSWADAAPIHRQGMDEQTVLLHAVVEE